MQHETHQSEPDEKSIDAVFALLSDRYRRDVIEICSERETSIPLNDLAAAIAAGETESSCPSTETTHDVATTLHHVHLPKLDDADVIDYDTETSTVTPLRADEFASFATSIEDEQ